MRQDAKAKADVQFRLSYRFPCCCFLFTAPVSKQSKMRGPKSCQDKSVPSRSQGCHLRVADATRAKAVTFGWQMRAGSDEMKMQPRFPDQDRTGEAKRRVGWPIRTCSPTRDSLYVLGDCWVQQHRTPPRATTLRLAKPVPRKEARAKVREEETSST